MLLMDLNVQVPAGTAGRAGLTAPGHTDAGARGYARRDIDIDGGAHVPAALPVAVAARGGDNGAEPLAARARRGGHHVAQERALHALDGAPPVALRAGARTGPLGAARPAAGPAGDVGVDRKALGRPEGHVRQVHFEGHQGILAPPRPGGRTARGGSAPEEGLLEEVAEAPGVESPVRVHGLLPAQVVHLTLVGVGENLVGDVDGLELVLMARAGDIGVQPPGLLLVGALDLVGGGLAAHAENLVVVAHAC